MNNFLGFILKLKGRVLLKSPMMSGPTHTVARNLSRPLVLTWYLRKIFSHKCSTFLSLCLYLFQLTSGSMHIHVFNAEGMTLRKREY